MRLPRCQNSPEQGRAFSPRGARVPVLLTGRAGRNRSASPRSSPMLHCRRCGANRPIGLSERIALLRSSGKLRRDARPDPALVEALFDAELPLLRCGNCGEASLEIRDEPLDPEDWGEARRCGTCRKPIHPDRLEILPDTRQCAACAAVGAAAGASSAADDREFCPRCGAELRLVAVHRGVTRYASQCSGCGFRG